MAYVEHRFAPVWNAQSRILILGTMPSPGSRQNRFYYSHPQNRFWPLMSRLLGCSLPETPEDKRDLLLRHGVALWDVLKSCDIKGAEDSSIRDVTVNDIAGLLCKAPFRAVFTTGKKATSLYSLHCLNRTGRPAHYLPSTSPANAGRYPLPELEKHWRVILDYLEPVSE